MSAVVSSIQGRLYAINQTITGVNAVRVFNGQPDSAMLPLIFSVPGRSSRNTSQIGAQRDEQTRIFRLILVVEAWMAGFPTETAQLSAETLIDTIQEAYLTRPRLELDDAPLDAVSRVLLPDDTGIVPFGPYAAVEYPLAITYHKRL